MELHWLNQEKKDGQHNFIEKIINNLHKSIHNDMTIINFSSFNANHMSSS